MTARIRRVQRVVASAGLAAAALVGAITTSAEGHYSSSPYTYPSGCPRGSGPVDPINVVFYGFTATAAGTSASLDAIPHWSYGGGSQQSFFTHDTCEPQSSQNADDNLANDRYHIRLFDVIDRDRKGRYEETGDAHRDHTIYDPSSCNLIRPVHVSAGFNQPRDVLYRNYVGVRGVHYVRRGNTAKLRQCNGSKVSSDGNQLWIHLRRGE